MVAVERGRNLALPAHDSSLGGGAASSANGDFDGAPAQPPAPYVTQLLSYVLIYLSTYLPPPPSFALPYLRERPRSSLVSVSVLCSNVERNVELPLLMSKLPSHDCTHFLYLGMSWSSTVAL
jgi:hypothetical protein